MSIIEILEIDENLLRPEHDEAMVIAENLWEEDNCPEQAPELIDTLERVLRRCQSSGAEYPKVLLLRKKGLERGTWKPKFASVLLPQSTGSGADTTQKYGITGNACEACRGLGGKLIKGGTALDMCKVCWGRGTAFPELKPERETPTVGVVRLSDIEEPKRNV